MSEMSVQRLQSMAGDCGQEPNDNYMRAQLACQEMVIESLRLIDDGQASKVRAMFVADGEHTLNGAVFAGEALTAFFNARQAMTERRTRHCVSNLSFRLHSQNCAEVRSTVVVYLLSLDTDEQRRIPRGIVDFNDRFVRKDEHWYLSRREATIVAGER
jgi:hypothetical protein